MDKDRNSKKIVFMRKARDFFDKQVEKEEEKLERELTNKERRETRKKNRKKARVVAIVASFALGVAGGAVGSHLLDSGHNIEVVEKKNIVLKLMIKKLTE